jgi:hypothetical protein
MTDENMIQNDSEKSDRRDTFAIPVDETVSHEQPRHEISDEDRDEHVAALRQLAQNIRNRNDLDTNRILDNMQVHFDALDGNPEEREAKRFEAEQAEKREQARVGAEKA